MKSKTKRPHINILMHDATLLDKWLAFDLDILFFGLARMRGNA
jgi:hypothetical protein